MPRKITLELIEEAYEQTGLKPIRPGSGTVKGDCACPGYAVAVHLGGLYPRGGNWVSMMNIFRALGYPRAEVLALAWGYDGWQMDGSELTVYEDTYWIGVSVRRKHWGTDGATTDARAD